MTDLIAELQRKQGEIELLKEDLALCNAEYERLRESTPLLNKIVLELVTLQQRAVNAERQVAELLAEKHKDWKQKDYDNFAGTLRAAAPGGVGRMDPSRPRR